MLPLSSLSSLNPPSACTCSEIAAYFIFFSSNMDLKTPSISISRSLYILLTSAFTLLPRDITSAMSGVGEMSEFRC